MQENTNTPEVKEPKVAAPKPAAPKKELPKSFPTMWKLFTQWDRTTVKKGETAAWQSKEPSGMVGRISKPTDRSGFDWTVDGFARDTAATIAGAARGADRAARKALKERQRAQRQAAEAAKAAKASEADKTAPPAADQMAALEAELAAAVNR